MDGETQDQSDLFNPFPGLRPFKFEENYLFFGREQQVDELTQLLSRRKFIAVVGSSGSGKSSLVTAGLLPNLYEGFMLNAGSRWRVVSFRPGNDPIGNMAHALTLPEVWENEDAVSSEIQITISETVLRSSKNGLVDLIEQARLPEGENILVIADQFEELFRFRDDADNTDATDDAQDFVRLLLTAKDQTAVPIYVILTMRSDFLGECAQFEGLPEAINEGQYLVPRLTRFQRQQAIEGPIAVGDAKISSALMQRLLNDVGNEPDYLPILQHALMRTWEHWTQNQELDTPIDVKNYEAIGGMGQALSDHANEIFDELKSTRIQKIAEILFKRITELGVDNREYRRPTTLADICQVAEASPAEVTAVIDRFRGPGRSFLMPPRGTELKENTIIDISHESLMRVWDRLDAWVKEEADSARIYKRLAQTAQLHAQGKAGLWSDPDLGIALGWEVETQPNQTWARRYDSHFDVAMDFLRSSEEEQKSIRRRRLLGVITILVFSALFFVVGVVLFNRAETARMEAEIAQVAAEAAQAVAATSQARAEDSEKVALTAEAQAKIDREAAVDALEKARKSKADRLGTEALSKISDAQLSLLLSIEAISTTRTVESETAFILAYQAALQPVASTLNANVAAFAFSPISNTFATRDWYGSTQLWYWGEGIEIDELEPIDLLYERDESSVYYYRASISDLTFTDDGKWLATATQDGTTRVWDLSDESLPSRDLLNLPEEGPVMGLSVFDDPQNQTTVNVATAYLYSGGVKVWDAKTEKPTLPYQNDQNPLSFGGVLALNGDTLATTGTDNVVFIYDLRNKNREPYYFHKTTITILEFSPDNTKIASASRDNTVRIWNTQGNGEDIIELEGFESAITELIFDETGDKLATASEAGIVRIWDANSGEEITVLDGCTVSIGNLVFSQDGTKIAASSEYFTYLWDIEEDSLIAKFADPDYFAINSVFFSPQDNYLVTLNSNGNVQFWDIADIDIYPNFFESCSDFTDIVFNTDGSILAGAQENGRIQLIDTQTRKPVSVYSDQAAPFTDLAFSHGNDLLATSSLDGSVHLWDLTAISETLTTTNNITTELATLLGSSKGVNSVSFNADDTLLAAGGEDGFVYIWKIDNTDQITPTAWKKLLWHVEAINKIAFSQDGEILATASQDHTVQLWNVADLEAKPVTLIAHEDEVYGVAFSPKGDLLATSSFDGTVILWEISPDDDFVKANPVATLIHGDPIYEVAFNADGSMLASAVEDHTVRVWDVSAARTAKNGEMLAEKTILWGHEEAVSAVAFHPLENQVATASWDNTIRLVSETDWLSATQEILVELGCKQAARNLMLSEWREYLEESEEEQEYKIICDLPKHPSVAEYYIRLGQIYARQRDEDSVKEAIIAFNKADEIDPSLGLNPEAEVLLAQIVFAAKKGDIEIALKELDDAIAQYSDITEKANAEVTKVLLENAQEHLRDGEIEKAKRNIEAAIGLGAALNETDFAQTLSSELLNYAYQYSYEGKYDETLLVINWAVEIDPDLVTDASQTLWNLGLEYPDFAVTAIPRAIELDSDRVDGAAEALYNYAKTFYNDARTYNEVQMYAQASAVSALITTIDGQLEVTTAGELATLYNDICWYGSLNGAASEVLTACENAVKLSPENGWFFDSRGLARALTGDYPGAVEDFNFFITSYANDPNYDGLRSVRQAWISTLEAGNNPFDEATLEILRGQP